MSDYRKYKRAIIGCYRTLHNKGMTLDEFESDFEKIIDGIRADAIEECIEIFDEDYLCEFCFIKNCKNCKKDKMRALKEQKNGSKAD